MAKGDSKRPSSIPREEYEENFKAIFGEKKLNLWEDKDDDLGTGEGDNSCGGPDNNVPKEPDGQPDPKTVPPTETEKQRPCPHCGNLEYAAGGGLYDCCGGVQR